MSGQPVEKEPESVRTAVSSQFWAGQNLRQNIFCNVQLYSCTSLLEFRLDRREHFVKLCQTGKGYLTCRSKMCKSLILFHIQGMKVVPQAGIENIRCLQKPSTIYKSQEYLLPFSSSCGKNFICFRIHFIANNSKSTSANMLEGGSRCIAVWLGKEAGAYTVIFQTV